MTVRTRFAPSPTGHLHIGGARVALYCWLYARHCGGQFILRIEDTDLERSTPESVQVILEGMAWLGLSYDEGPYYQTQRVARYQEVANQLIAAGHAYRCFCSKERLEQLRITQMAHKEKPRYDGHCRQLTQSPSGSFVIRFRNPQTGVVSFTDQVRGVIRVDNQELDDLVIVRSDGMPTYNFSAVVDDWDMKITHVIRGDDHINNTPRQINMLQVLGATLPVYAHLPLILSPDGKKLSKRDGAASIMDYREAGYLPHAVLNYLVRLGWSHQNQEIFSIEEMIAAFDLSHLSRSAAALNTEKLLWLNHHYLKTLPIETLVDELQWQLGRSGLRPDEGPSLTRVALIQRERVKTLKDMMEHSRCFYGDNVVYNDELRLKYLTKDQQPLLNTVYHTLDAVNDWSATVLHAVIGTTAQGLGIKLGALALPLRIAVMGTTASPPLDAALELIGKNRVLKRLQYAINLCNRSLG